MLKFPLSILALVLLAGPVTAQRIYTWTDDNGITHFTDKPPAAEGDDPIAVLPSRAEPGEPLEVVNRGSDRRPEWTFINRLHGPLAVRVEPTRSENAETRPSLPADFVLPGDTERELFTLRAREIGRGWSFGFRTTALPGDPAARHDPGAVYRPPFAPGKTYRIGQAFGGRFSHTGKANFHAVDFQMPRGTPVHAARAGVVMAVEKYFEDGGDDRARFAEKANYVRIVHDDGSMAVYAHLDYDSIRPSPGDVLLEGDYIGNAGESGFATGPHLHFVVQENTDMQLESVPIRFRNADGQTIEPAKNLELTAP